MNDTMQTNDLNWTAFRYVANELSPEEAAAFEARLVDDQAACEAVARAVQLSAAVNDACREVRPSKLQPAGSAYRPQTAVAALSMAGIVLLSVGLLQQSATTPVDTTSTTIADRDTPQSTDATDLISLWNTAAPDNAPNEDEINVAERGPSLDVAESDEAELVVPGWMIAAVSNDVDDDSVEETNEL